MILKLHFLFRIQLIQNQQIVCDIISHLFFISYSFLVITIDEKPEETILSNQIENEEVESLTIPVRFLS
jgi:hypothetical protein